MISTADARRGAVDAIDRYVNSEPTTDAVLRRVAELLAERFDHYSWVGFYLVEGDDLVLAAWSGPEATEHERIRLGNGICGAAAASGLTEVVDDVVADARYIACFPSTRSEIVVPIFAPGRAGSARATVLGEIDIDSDTPAAFDDGDRAFLEHVARMVSTRL
jgi:L-methionine (R)-S-oxide reductase